MTPVEKAFSSLELAWGTLAAVLAAFGLIAVGLAQANLFQLWALLAGGLLCCVMGWGVWRVLGPLSCRTPSQEILFLAAILGAGLLLYCWPAQHLPQLGDSSIYPNTAAMLVRTGGLTYRYDPLDGLTPRQKQLFYVPADKQFSNIEMQSYEGLVYGAYYVMDPDQNTIVASRPPLAIAWMGLLGMLAGEQGMFYVTPLFGVASLVTVYFLGKRVFDAGAGALAALWLLVSFSQLHFSRTSYAEVVGQLFVLTFLYALVAYWQTRRLAFIPMGVVALTAAFAARIDTLLAVPTLLLFTVLLALRRDWGGIVVSLAGVIIAVGFTLWTVNRPYVGATAELLLAGQLRFLRQLAVWVFLGLAGLLALTLLAWLARRGPPVWLGRALRWGLLLVVILGLGYALHVRPLMPEYVLLADGTVAQTYNEEIMAVTAQYSSPLYFWLAALGIILALWRTRVRFGPMLLLLFLTSFGGVFFWRYTTGRVYPVALRRLVPEVLPALALFGASAVLYLSRRPRFRWLAMAVAGLVTALLMGISVPYWFHQGTQGAVDLLDTLAERIPSDAVVLFEPRQDGAIVGWFASPLWSLRQRNALLLDSGELDGGLLDETVCRWERLGKDVYVIAQHDPMTWWPGAFQGNLAGEVGWKSSIIGQSLRFPPFIWRFAFQFSIYQWDGTLCPAF